MRRFWERGNAATATIVPQEPDQALFNEELLALTRRLSLTPRSFTPEGLAGEHRSRRRGSSPEFADFKSYSQGDDFRRIDWNIYGRLGALFVRLSEVTTEIPVHILLDSSASMLWSGAPERPQKFTVARQIAGMLGYLSLQRSDRVVISPFASGFFPSFGPSQGRAAVTPMLSYLTGLRAHGETDLRAALERYARERKRPGFALLISDLLSGEPDDLAAGLRAFRAHGWEVAVLHIVDPAEVDPELFAATVTERGAVDLIDLESRGHIRLALSEDVVLRCQEATGEWLGAIEEACRSEVTIRVVIDTSTPLSETLRRLHEMGDDGMNGLALLVPAGLLALISVPLVVLFHMRSPTPKSIPVPAIRFWRVAAPKPTDEPRFQRPPITPGLLIHIAVALLLSLALARPISSFALGAVNASTEPHHLIVVLDGSTSMLAVDDGVSRFDLARKETLSELGSLRAGDAATVLLLGNTISTFSASDAGSMQALKDRIESIDAPGGVADLTSALLLAHDLHVPGMLNDLVLISDGALEVDPSAAANVGMAMRFAEVGMPDAGNLAITSISARANPSNPAEQQVTGHLANFSDQPATVPVQFLADELVVANQTVQIDANAQKELVFSAPPGTVTAEIRIASTDAQVVDDRAAIVLGADQALSLKVLIFSDAPDALQRVFSSMPGAQVTVETTDVVAEGYGTGGFDLVVYDRVAPDRAPAAPALVIQPPDSPLLRSPSMLSDPTPDEITQSDPLLKDVDINGVTFGPTPRYELPAGFTTVVAAIDGPLLAYGALPESDTPVVLLAGNLDESNLTQRIAFPILMANIAEKLSPSPAPQTLSLGEPLLISPRPGAVSVTVTNPAGDEMTIDTPSVDGLPQRARQVSYGQTNLIGSYRLREIDANEQTLVTGMVTVNAGNVTESNLRTNPDLAGLLAQPAADADGIEKQDRRSDLWPILALLALGLLIADWLLTLRSPHFSTRPLARGKGGSA